MQVELKRIIQISDALDSASNEIRILRNISWPLSVKEEFFTNNAQKLPVVSYNPYDPSAALAYLKNARKLIQTTGTIDNWARRIADKLESSAMMVASRGTSDFHKYSVEVYGSPKDEVTFCKGSTLDLANHFDELFVGIKNIDLGAPPDACILASFLAEQMREAVTGMFGDLAPEVVMDETLASNALAGRRRISIRPTACFTDNDIQQLIEHEAYIHVATSINGKLQPHIKILGEGHAGTTKTQEGLAVFAEFITGTIDLDRVRRLSDRVIAIQMAMDGANFIDVYKYFLSITDNPGQSFENAKRVFRGGLMEGGAPFTKDLVYLHGLIDVHSFLKVAVSQGKIDYLDLLFCGKLDIEDLPALKEMSEMGLVDKAKFYPKWMSDKRFLLTHLSYSAFVSGLDFESLSQHYEQMLK